MTERCFCTAARTFHPLDLVQHPARSLVPVPACVREEAAVVAVAVAVVVVVDVVVEVVEEVVVQHQEVL